MSPARRLSRPPGALAVKEGGGATANPRTRIDSAYMLLIVEAFFCRIRAFFAHVGHFPAPFPSPVWRVVFPPIRLYISLSFKQTIERERNIGPKRGKDHDWRGAHVYLRNHFNSARVAPVFFSDSRRLAHIFCNKNQLHGLKYRGLRKCAVCFVPMSIVEC